MVAPDAPLLPPRGRVLENGAPRFFRRLAEGVFDEADVRARADELADFVAAARVAYDLAPLIALGYSNGANIAAAVLLLRPEALDGAILLRAMAPLAIPPAQGGLSGKAVLIVSGASDPVAPPAHAARLKAMLGQSGARVDPALSRPGTSSRRRTCALRASGSMPAAASRRARSDSDPAVILRFARGGGEPQFPCMPRPRKRRRRGHTPAATSLRSNVLVGSSNTLAGKGRP
jgi:predicted esterase